MYEIPLIALAGLLGSSHCLGMCGSFALAIGSGAPTWSENLWRQSVYSAGRIFTYAVMGSVAGFGGARLASAIPSAVQVPAILAIISGLLLIYQGFLATGVLGRSASSGSSSPCLGSSFFAEFLTGEGLHSAFLAGIFTGFLPCGLVYAFLTLAVGSGSWLAGLVTMTAFGLGTVPIMVVAGLGGALLGLVWRARMMQIAAWAVVITGCVSIARGFGFLPLLAGETGGSCPFCNS